MACTKEEIERKRLAALQKRQSKAGESNSNAANAAQTQTFSPATPFIASPVAPSSYGQSKAGPMKSFNGHDSKGHHPYARPENHQRAENMVPVTKVVTGSVYLISEERFEVNPSEFCVPLINVFKSIPSKCYDSKSKLWNFSIDHHQELMTKAAPLAPHVVLEPIPQFVLKILQEQYTDPNTIDLSPIEATLRHKLMPFQEDGVRFALSRRGRCMIADDMGLGKTFQALAVASYYRHNWPLLIVTTSSMRETWQSKIYELLPSIPLMNIVTWSSGKDAQLVADRQTEVVIVSYKITSMHKELLMNKKFGVVIIDESHHLKSHKAQCTVSLNYIARHASRVVLLSGTPALSRPSELYTQLTLVQPRLVSYSQYGQRYCDGKLTKFGWDMSGQSNLAELQALLQRKFLIRRTKEQVLTQLERKTRESVILDQSLLEFSKEDQQGLTQMAQAYQATQSNERHAALLKFFSESARVKIPAISKYIRQLVKDESTGKFLVFAHHRSMIDAICLTLDEAGVHYICITGATPSNSRADLVDKFQYTESCRCAVLSITAANSGITLTAASLVLFAELHWNPGILTQAECRAHRIGQTGGVCVRYLLAHNTVDDVIWPMLQSKLNVLNDVGLSKDTFEDTTTKHQETKYNITQYLSPSAFKNKNDYIPGTNIRKDSLKNNSESGKENYGHSSKDNNEYSTKDSYGHSSKNDSFGDLNGDASITEECDKSFLDDDEDDELLANMDL